MAENKIIKLDYEAIDDAIADLNALVEELDTMCIVPEKSGENRGICIKQCCREIRIWRKLTST